MYPEDDAQAHQPKTKPNKNLSSSSQHEIQRSFDNAGKRTVPSRAATANGIIKPAFQIKLSNPFSPLMTLLAPDDDMCLGH